MKPDVHVMRALKAEGTYRVALGEIPAQGDQPGQPGRPYEFARGVAVDVERGHLLELFAGPALANQLQCVHLLTAPRIRIVPFTPEEHAALIAELTAEAGPETVGKKKRR